MLLNIPQLHAAVGPLEQVGYPPPPSTPSKVPQQGKLYLKSKKIFPFHCHTWRVSGGYPLGIKRRQKRKKEKDISENPANTLVF